MVRRPALLFNSLLLVFLLYLSHVLANQYYLYWRFWWFDVLNHFLAGLALGLTIYWFFYHSGYSSSAKVMITVVFLVLLAGVAWEVFEYFIGTTDSHEGYLLDVFNDLILDGSGGVLAVLIGLRKRNG